MRFLIRSCGTFNFHFLFEQITAEWTSDTSDTEFMSIPMIDATKIVSSKTNDKIVFFLRLIPVLNQKLIIY